MMNWTKTGAGAITVTVPNRASLCDDIEAHLRESRGFSVATLNLDHVVKLDRDPAFREAYAAQTHVTADGNPIVWLSHLSGQRDIELTPGSELIDPVAALAARLGTGVALIGATEHSLETAAQTLGEKYPGLTIALTLSPPMGFDPTGQAADAVIEEIRASGARLVILALGAPKQEIFAIHALGRLPDVGFLSTGAGLDFIAGNQRRAPAWVRALAAEWLWRLLANPGRMAGRYAACVAALPGLVLRSLALRFRRPAP